MARHLLVPGRGVPRPEHWLRRLADAHPDYRWAPYPPDPPFVLSHRVAALHEAVTADPEPAILVAHSAGCIAAVTWAHLHPGPVRGALLVTPPHIDVPRSKLPFRAILVASRTDPCTTFAQFEQFADDWGADLFDAGDAGHLDTTSGYGPWPAGQRLLRTLE